MKIPLRGAPPPSLSLSPCPLWMLKASAQAAVVTCRGCVVFRICCLSSDKSLIDGEVNKRQGSLQASVAKG